MHRSAVDEILKRIRELEADLEAVFESRRKKFSYHLERQKIIFERDALQRQKRLRPKLMAFLQEARFWPLVTAPVIYAMILPISIIDLAVTVYQYICFRAYGIARVRRGDYVVIDRHMLAYLNPLQKLNCVYCGYANGVFAYAGEIAARTEQYWCPIKHARRPSQTHGRYLQFAEFGDAENYPAVLKALRADLLKELEEDKSRS